MGMMPTKELPKLHNPSDHNAYYKDARDKPDPTDRQWGWPQESDAPPYPRPQTEEREKSTVSWLEMRIRALAMASEDKPRWQKIIEHANALADEQGMPHEQFYATALIQYIGKLENEKFTHELNESYKDTNQDEDVAVLNYLVDHYDTRFADE